MRDDRSNFKIAARDVQAHTVGHALAADSLMSNDCLIHIVSQPWGHRIGVAFCPIGDEFPDNGSSWRIAAVGGKNGLHTLTDLQYCRSLAGVRRK